MTDLHPSIMRYFPYKEVRPFQDEFITTIFEAVENGNSAIVEGSNGLGKTIAALSACLPTAVEKDLKILYVARTHRQHDRVIEELKGVAEKQGVSGVSVRGRHEMCLNRFVMTNANDSRAVMEICELLKAKGRCPFYRNIEEKKGQFVATQQRVTFRPHNASEIQKICRGKGYCPYELVKTALPEVNVVALSYLYVFDPVIRTSFLKNLGVSLNKVILIIDEAHNLPETAINIASVDLTLFTLRQAEVEAKQFKHKEILAFAKILRSEIEATADKIHKETAVPPEFFTKLIKERAGIDKPKEFFAHLYAIGNAIRRDLLLDGKNPRSFIHAMGDFLLKWLETVGDESFVNVITKYKSRRGVDTAKLEIVALDPSQVTEPVFSEVYSNLVMSGTLQPLDAYVQITGLPSGTIRKVVPSPFPKEHILPLVSTEITTAMDQRTPQMYDQILTCICEVVENTPANTGVFTASFGVLEALRSNGLQKRLRRPLYFERRGMSSIENERMVNEFKTSAHHDGAVLLGVQGGRSSEGVDFPGDQMNSVVIVGVPYAEPTPKVRAQIEFFEKRFPGLGREYGYVIPAMKKASQAAGRPIRTPDDKAAMIFLDYRFSTLYCRRFLPLWIRDNLRILPQQDGAIARELVSFFKRDS